MARDDIAALSAFSAKLGADRKLVQGGGGNTSLKRGDCLWVKASGTWLAHAREQDIFVSLPLPAVRDALVEGEDALARLAPAGGLRPSIETSLHALLPHVVVAHVHSVNAIAWAVRHEARQQLQARLEGLRWSWVPYRRPGYPLTRAVAQVLVTAEAPPDVLVLANHGLVVGAGDCAAAQALLDDVERRLSIEPRTVQAADLARLRALNDLGWQLPEQPLLHAIGTDEVTSRVATRGALYPDHVVFLGPRALRVEGGRTLSQAIARTAAPPVYAIVPGAGVLLAPGISDGARAMLECLALVGLRLAGASGLDYLDPEEVAALTDWEAEAYRRSRDRLPAAG